MLYPGYVRKPHYYETDQMGIIHHSNYIRWFEEARVDMLAFLQLPYETIEAEGLIVPVLEVSCQYKQMIRYGDTVTIQLFIEDYTGTRLNFIYEIRNASDELVTTGTSKHCFLEKNNQRLVHLKKRAPLFHQIFSDYLKKSTKNC